jgi:hypothetical protein
MACSRCIQRIVAGAGVGKTQLVKGKLASLSEDMMSLSISFNYFTDVVSFQKVGCPAGPMPCHSVPALIETWHTMYPAAKHLQGRPSAATHKVAHFLCFKAGSTWMEPSVIPMYVAGARGAP